MMLKPTFGFSLAAYFPRDHSGFGQFPQIVSQRRTFGDCQELEALPVIQSKSIKALEA